MWLAGRFCIAFMGAWSLWIAVGAFNGGPAPLVAGWEGFGPRFPMWASSDDALWIAAGFTAGAVVVFCLAFAPKPPKEQ